jgi:tetratricopeptide (TPR) repeat protein
MSRKSAEDLKFDIEMQACTKQLMNLFLHPGTYFEKINKVEPLLYYMLARCNDNQEEYVNSALAREHYKSAIELGNPDAMWRLGTIYHEYDNDYEHAKELYLKAIENGNREAIFDLARLFHYSLNDTESAKKYYIMDIEIGDEGYETHTYLGHIYEEENNYELAIKHYTQAIEKGDTETDTIISLANIYNSVNKDYENAKKYYKMGLFKCPNMKFMDYHEDWQKYMDILNKTPNSNEDLFKIALRYNNLVPSCISVVTATLPESESKFIMQHTSLCKHCRNKDMLLKKSAVMGTCDICFESEKTLIPYGKACNHTMCGDCYISVHHTDIKDATCPFCRQ